MKYTHILLAAFAALLVSCASTAKPKSSCCASGKTKPAPVALAKTCDDPMSSTCRGECSPQDCRCKPQRCHCAPKVVAKPKPAPAKVAVAKPVPPPAVRESPPPLVTVQEGWQRYRWEFANPKNTVPVRPDEPLPDGVAPIPAQNGFWMKGQVIERQVPAVR